MDRMVLSDNPMRVRTTRSPVHIKKNTTLPAVHILTTPSKIPSYLQLLEFRVPLSSGPNSGRPSFLSLPGLHFRYFVGLFLRTGPDSNRASSPSLPRHRHFNLTLGCREKNLQNYIYPERALEENNKSTFFM